MYRQCDMNTIAGWSQTPAMIISTILFRLPSWNHAILNPALSDGNIEQVYGKLRPRAVHHTSVMAPAFKIGVRVRVGESFMGSFTEQVKGYLTLDSFLSEGNVTDWLQAGPELLWSMILPDLTLFPGCLGHCFSGILQPWLISTSQVCVCEGESERGSLTFHDSMRWLGCKSSRAYTVRIGYKYPHTFKEVLFYQLGSSFHSSWLSPPPSLFLSLSLHIPLSGCLWLSLAGGSQEHGCCDMDSWSLHLSGPQEVWNLGYLS